MRLCFSFFFALKLFQPITPSPDDQIPIVINTWGFTNATIEAWDVLSRQKKSAVSAKNIFCYFVNKETFLCGIKVRQVALIVN